jgi:hypothetical protein
MVEESSLPTILSWAQYQLFFQKTCSLETFLQT